MDTRPHQQQIPSGYPALNGSPHNDIIIQSVMPSHDMSSLFSTNGDASNATNGPGPIHVSMGEPSNSVKMSAMDFLESATPVRASAPGFISDFPPTNGFGAVHHLNNHTVNLTSSSGASSVSSNPSHVPSSTMHGTQTNYNGTSSLASALDSMGTSRSRSGSSASPGTFANATPEFTYPSAGTTSVRSSPEFHFPPADMALERKGGSPDTPADSHLMAIGGLLAK